MNIAILYGNIIQNVIAAPDGANPEDFGGVPLPEGKWIGDPVKDHEPTQIDQIQAQITYTALKTGTLINQGGIK